MPTDVVPLSAPPGGLALLSSRARYVLAWTVAVTGLAVGGLYHTTSWLMQQSHGATLQVLYTVLILCALGALALILTHHYLQRRFAPAQGLWVTALGGLVCLGVMAAIAQLGYQPLNVVATPELDVNGFDYTEGFPLEPVTVIKTNVISIAATVMTVLLLLVFRGLVFVKRTRASQRNWYLMLTFMVAAALSAFGKHPQELHLDLAQLVLLIPAVVLMVINSMRLSWIVSLSFREKSMVIVLSVALLMILLNAGMVPVDVPWPWGEMVPGSFAFVRHYSYPLALFTMMAFLFGILYCTTALLSLLFHLPTTSDYQQRAGEVAVMQSLTHLVGQVFDPEKLFGTIVASPVEAGSATMSWLAMADPQSGSLRPRIVATYNVGWDRVRALADTDALYEEVASTRASVLLRQAPLDHRVYARPGEGLGSLLATPLTARDELLGVLFAAKEVTHGFESDDVNAISIFAAQAALALDNARLFEERVEKERLARELAIAREVQHKLLPQTLPQLEGLTIAASSISAHEVGGDYYDFVTLADRRLGIIIGDVSGKGTSAAFYMAKMHGIFQSISRLTPTPADFLDLANTALSSALDRNIFISAVYGILDLEAETFVLARAGHCPVATINLHGEARYLRPQGMGLGLDRGTLFRQTLVEEHLDLQPGDVYVLYTDGVVESRSPDDEEYGYERLLDVLRENRHEDADDLHKALLADLDGFIGPDAAYADDLTLVVLKWHGLDLATPMTLATQQHTPIAEEFPPE